MKNVVLHITTAVVVFAAFGVAAPSERIIGGTTTTDGDFPEMVSVFQDPLVGGRQHMCGGIIVNDNHVLTTATCVEGEGTLNLYVMAAGSNLNAPNGYEEFKSVQRIFIHEEFEPTSKINDIAILRTSHNFVFVNGLVSPVVLPLPDTPEPASGTLLTTVGWGKDSADGEIQTQQKTVNLPYLEQTECKEVFGMFVQPNEGCLQSTADAGVCVGDEGGVVRSDNETAVAMVSWHINCNEFPAVVTLLAPYYDWIVGKFEA